MLRQYFYILSFAHVLLFLTFFFLLNELPNPTHFLIKILITEPKGLIPYAC